MPSSDIVIKGAREHNLRNVDLVLPRNQLICLTGVSGSGKSSLAFDTLYAEGQRRYIESLSSFARQFLGQMPKPNVDFIGGLSPSISISQKSAGTNPRSTVGTITEIYDYLRVLFARVGEVRCPTCDLPVAAQTQPQIVQRILELPGGTRFVVLAPLIRRQKGEYRDLFVDLRKQGFARARVDGSIVSLSDDLQLDRQMRHDIEVVVDRLTVRSGMRTRLAEAVELALKVGHGTLILQIEEGPAASNKGTSKPELSPLHRDLLFSSDYACGKCGTSLDPPSPQLFSFNSPQGMCPECDGLGESFSFDIDLLIPDKSLSFKQGCFQLIGSWKQLGRWRRHIYQGVADTIERKRGLQAGTLLETPWKKLRAAERDVWLWGTGDMHISFTWRGGASPIKYGGHFGGIVPELMQKYRTSRSKVQLRRLSEYMRSMRCPSCAGQRLNEYARAVKITTSCEDFGDQRTRSIAEICGLPVSDATKFFQSLQLDATRAIIAAEALKEIRGRLGFLMNVGLDYLSLDRTAPTLSGGESQRIRLAGQIGCGLVGVLYILDEPSIGLHPRDNARLLDTLTQLRDVGNTVVVVEHDEDTMRHSDHVIDFGPGPGVRGGEIVAAGSVADVMRQQRSVTGRYLSGKEQIVVPASRRRPGADCLKILAARHNNLKAVDVSIPLGTLVCVTGVSGSGKSSLVSDILVEALRRDLNRGNGEPGAHDGMEGLEHLDKMIAIDQSPIGRTPRSNPGTYIKVLDDIRKLFSQLPESRRRGYKPGRFSFNVDGGRCQACDGNGANRLEMDFLADIWVTCPVCEGRRFNRETLGVKFKGNSISDVLEMDVQQALSLFENIPKVNHMLQTLHDVGLDYVKLGQPSPTLSGGEAQRIKLARELVKKSTGQTLYLLDEPTTGLHFADIQMLLTVLHGFVDAGNTVLIVEHNLDVIKTADWIIDLGLEGGAGGGQIVAEGTPEQVARKRRSYTGRALAQALRPRASASSSKRMVKKRRAAKFATHLTVEGARQHNLRDVSAKIKRDEMTVFCGPSGSGKSSLAMDTIYAEGQRRYVESLSAYARQFVGQMQKPELKRIDGLSPAIAIEQQNLGNTPRSTVGTTTEIHDYLRVLMARLGTPHCPDCDVPIGTQTLDEIVERVMGYRRGSRLYLMAPVHIEVGQKYELLWENLRADGFLRVRVNGETCSLDDPPEIDRRRKHLVEAIVDRVVVKADSRSRIAESIEATLALGRGVMHVALAAKDTPESEWQVDVHNQHLACDRCGQSYETLTPHSFSFNSYLGWCPECEGLGVQTGANPAALLRGSQLTLADGALLLWPNLDKKISMRMLETLSSGTGIPLHLPFDQLAARHRRLLMHGTGDTWFDVHATRKPARPPLFRFQFKGLYPALDEAARLSPSLRGKLNHLVDEVECSACGGSRLRPDAAAVRFCGLSLDELGRLPLGELQSTVSEWKLSARDRQIAGEILREIKSRVKFLNDVGLEYLTLSRPTASLSGGEAQRIRLASQLGSGLCGILYVLDEPTIGLHPRDNARLLGALHRLRDLGNTLLIVEHDREIIAGSDAVLDFGPGAGREGGQIVATGSPDELGRRRKSVTGPYLAGRKAITIPSNRRPVIVPDTAPANGKKTRAVAKRNKLVTQPPAGEPQSNWSTDWLVIRGARHHNLKNLDVHVPLGRLVAVTGPSGSGKSSLIDDVLYASLAAKLNRARTIPGAHDGIDGLAHINKVIRVDQHPLGNSPTSNPVTYTGAFDHIRQLFSQMAAAKLRGYTARRFSFNVPGGRCEACEGNGQKCIEMHFLPDVWVTCETCGGKRYNAETLEVTFHGQSIADVLEMTCAEAVELFRNIPKIRRTLQTLCDVGLDYLTLGQAAPTLSGGEAQRVKLASELSRPDTGRTLYLLDEPTTGLHFDDLTKLILMLQRLVDLGNTVVVIEHNLDVIKSCDWVIDMGPEAGAEGGTVVTVGTPEQVVGYAQEAPGQRAPSNGTRANGKRVNGKPVKPRSQPKGKRAAANHAGAPSYTGQALAAVLDRGHYAKRETYDPAAQVPPDVDETSLQDVGKDINMPWEVDGRKWHTEDRVGRRGEPCRWDGKILSEVVDRIHALGEFRDTDWNSRTVVEIAAPKKTDGWFLHAITGETWLLKLKFRVARNTFRKDQLLAAFHLKTLNDMHDLPVYGNEPRVKCRNVRGPWQEVEFRLHDWEETDTPAFWKFLKQAVAGFHKMTHQVASNPDDYTPWKKLGRKWHFSRKGFPPRRTIAWPTALLEELCEMLNDVAGDGQFLWNNQLLVHLLVPAQREPWATIVTKNPDAVQLSLNGPAGTATLGRIANLAHDRSIEPGRGKLEVVKLWFKQSADLRVGDFEAFLREHLAEIISKSDCLKSEIRNSKSETN